VPVLEPGRGRTRTGRLWAVVRDERPFTGTAPPAAFYRYSPDRRGELFAIEARVNGRPPPERLAARQQDAVPLLNELKVFLEKALSQISGKSTPAKAIRYSLSRWTALTRYTTDGRLEMTNNAVERAIKPLVLARKNYMFAGSDSGGIRAAAFHTIGTDERTRSGGLFARRPCTHRRPSDQSYRRVAALELEPGNLNPSAKLPSPAP
jgi:transposase